MDYFNGITDQFELKLVYRRLAVLNHPDMGGNSKVMKKINHDYALAKQSIKSNNTLLPLCNNDTVQVNDSPAKVIFVGKKTLILESLQTKRRAVFCRKKGVCISNPHFKISQSFRLSKQNLVFIENMGKSLGLNKTNALEMLITILRNDPATIKVLIQKALPK